MLLEQHLVGEGLPVDAERPEAKLIQARGGPAGGGFTGFRRRLGHDQTTTNAQKRRATFCRYGGPAEAAGDHNAETPTPGRIPSELLRSTPQDDDPLAQIQCSDRLLEEARASPAGIQEDHLEVRPHAGQHQPRQPRTTSEIKDAGAVDAILVRSLQERKRSQKSLCVVLVRYYVTRSDQTTALCLQENATQLRIG